MYADQHGLLHHDLTEKLIGAFFNIYNELGHGFLESVYEQAFSVALAENSVFFERQVAVPVWFHGQKIGDFRADLLVDRRIIVELKTGRDIEPAWEKQLLNYLRATEIEVGLLFNFGPTAQFRRYVFENKRKHPRKSVLISGEEV
jgi:GxxExxY protein